MKKSEDYQFNPEDFGFLPPAEKPEQLNEQFGNTTYVKIICGDPNGAFWYLACYSYSIDNRWDFTSGLYNPAAKTKTHYSYRL